LDRCFLQGFSQIKVLRSNRNVSCFVEFESVETAAMCHATQQVRARVRVHSWDRQAGAAAAAPPRASCTSEFNSSSR
jgi:hypothetical protein